MKFLKLTRKNCGSQPAAALLVGLACAAGGLWPTAEPQAESLLREDLDLSAARQVDEDELGGVVGSMVDPAPAPAAGPNLNSSSVPANRGGRGSDLAGPPGDWHGWSDDAARSRTAIGDASDLLAPQVTSASGMLGGALNGVAPP